jgi:hypothetical protein
VGSAAPPCEKCQNATKKIFHPSRVIFKGPGFYVTDLASEKSAATKTKGDGDASKADAGDAAPAESKTESKEAAPASPSSTSNTSDASKAPASGGDKK